MSNLARTDTLFGKRVNVAGNISADLVLESLGKVYIKSRNKAQTLEELIVSLVTTDPNSSTSRVKIVEGIENLDTTEFKEGTFVYDKLSNILYLFLDGELLELINVAPEGTGYVKRSGDTMTGRLAIYVKNGPPLYVNSSELVKNLNAEYLNGETADSFTRRNKNEKINGMWTFRKPTIFDSSIRVYKDIVLHGSIGSPNFQSGFGGYGWRMDADTNTLTVDNLVVRKLMQVYELVVNKISATNGSLWVSNAGKVTKALKLEIKDPSFFADTEEYKSFCLGLKDSFIKLTVPISNKVFADPNGAFTTASGDGIFVKQCWSEETLRGAQFIFIGGDDSDYSDLYFNDPDSDRYGIFPLFDPEFRFNSTFPVITRNNYATYKQAYDNVQATKERITRLIASNASQSAIDAAQAQLSNYQELADPKRYVSLMQTYYKYFANGDYYLVTFDADELPVFKPGDILRCQKWTYGGIKYYDSVVCNVIGRKAIIQLAPSFLDQKTTITYDEALNPNVTVEEDSDNTTLYSTTNKNVGDKLGMVEEKDSLVQIGNLWNAQRQNAVYITSTDDAAPYMSVLSDVNRPDYSVEYIIPLYKTIKLHAASYNLRAFTGFNYLVQIPYTGDYYVQSGADANPEYTCFKVGDTTYLASGRHYPNVANVQVLYYLNTIPNYETQIGEAVDSFYILLEDGGKILLEDGGALKEEEELSRITAIAANPVKAKLGNLDGIREDRFPIDKQPYGFGLYGQNVFLTGEFYLNNGQSVADIGKDAIMFATAAAQQGNAAMEILKLDRIRAENLIKATHYDKGTLRSAGMYIKNAQMVIWGNRLLFATTDAEFNGYVAPTMLLQDGKILGKYLNVQEAHSNISANVPPTKFTYNNDLYTSVSVVRVFRQKTLNYVYNGDKYFTQGPTVNYVRKFSVNGEQKWIIVNPDGLPPNRPFSIDEVVPVNSISYPQFTYYYDASNSTTYTNGVFDSNADDAFVTEYSEPLPTWGFEIDGKANIGGSTLYINPSGQVVVNGILQSKMGNIGGLYLGENSLYTDQDGYNPIKISTDPYAYTDSNRSLTQLPYVALTQKDQNGKFLNRAVLTSYGLSYQVPQSQNEENDEWTYFMSMQVPSTIFYLTVIPIFSPDCMGYPTLYARLSTALFNFEHVRITYEQGRYALNFDRFTPDFYDRYGYALDWFVKELIKGTIYFQVSGISTGWTDLNLNGDRIPYQHPEKGDGTQSYHPRFRFGVAEMLDNPNNKFVYKVEDSVKASIEYVTFKSDSYSYGYNQSNIEDLDFAIKYRYGADLSASTDRELYGEYSSGGIWSSGLSEDLFGSGTFNDNVIAINTSDDDSVNWGGFTLSAIYSPLFDFRYVARPGYVDPNTQAVYEEQEREQATNLRNQLIQEYGTDGIKSTELSTSLTAKINEMDETTQQNQEQDITDINTAIVDMISYANNIPSSSTLAEVQSAQSHLEAEYTNILLQINNLYTELPPEEEGNLEDDEP